jgi:nucleoid-associated protein YgaU
MPLSRYKRTPVLSFGAQYGTSGAVSAIRTAISNGILSTGEIILREGERLDVLAGQIYNDARYWWVLAAASDIGWGMQVPPGTVIRIPDLSDVANLIG